MVRSAWTWVFVFLVAIPLLLQSFAAAETRQRLHARGVTVGPVWIPSGGLRFDPAGAEKPTDIETATEGAAQQTFEWQDPEANAKWGPIRISVDWSSAVQPAWTHASSSCASVESTYAAANFVTWSSSDDGGVTCFAADKDTGAFWRYVTRLHTRRWCDRQTVAIIRTQEFSDSKHQAAPSSWQEWWTRFNVGLSEGLQRGLADWLVGESHLLPSPTCSARVNQLAVVPAFLGAAALAVTLGMFLAVRRRSVRAAAPLASQDDTAPPGTDGPAPEAHPRILVLDAREAVRKSLIKALGGADFEVRTYGNLDDLLHALLEGPAPRVVLSLASGAVKGTLRRVKAARRDAPVVVVLLRPTRLDRRQAYEAGTILLDESSCTVAALQEAVELTAG